MDCCVSKVAWCFSTEGLINVGQDEIVILLEYLEEESTVPKDVFYHITSVYNDAVKGNFYYIFQSLDLNILCIFFCREFSKRNGIVSSKFA